MYFFPGPRGRKRIQSCPGRDTSGDECPDSAGEGGASPGGDHIADRRHRVPCRRDGLPGDCNAVPYARISHAMPRTANALPGNAGCDPVPCGRNPLPRASHPLRGGSANTMRQWSRNKMPGSRDALPAERHEMPGDPHALPHRGRGNAMPGGGDQVSSAANALPN